MDKSLCGDCLFICEDYPAHDMSRLTEHASRSVMALILHLIISLLRRFQSEVYRQ